MDILRFIKKKLSNGVFGVCDKANTIGKTTTILNTHLELHNILRTSYNNNIVWFLKTDRAVFK